MSIYSSNIKAVVSALNREPEKVAAFVRNKIMQITTYINMNVHERTPVWSGLALRNMIWSTDRPNLSEHAAIESGPEGEGRRGANAAAAMLTFTTMRVARPFGKYILSNSAHHIEDLEAGLLPSPDRSRVAPGGIFFITFQEALGLLK